MGNANGALFWIVLLSALMFFGSIVVAWIVIVRMPSDYLTGDHVNEERFFFRHPLIRVVFLIIKNLFGLALMIMGVIMLLTPGQGVLCIFIGTVLLDFPGKQSIVRRMLSRRRVLNLINKIRDKAARPPLEVPSKY